MSSSHCARPLGACGFGDRNRARAFRASVTRQPEIVNTVGGMDTEKLPAVVIVTGPTASGKTAVAVDLARRFDGEIVNADSMQVFRHMDIGTAKPSREQRAAVPHHMIDVVTPDVAYSAGRYAQDARTVVADLHARGKRVFLTGGTGLYIRAIVEGLLSGAPADPGLREELEAEHDLAFREGDPLRLHRRLAGADPVAAAKIHPNDLRRVIRALEIHAQSGQTASKLREDHGFCERRYRVLHLALDPGRKELAARIDRRCRAMASSSDALSINPTCRESMVPSGAMMTRVGKPMAPYRRARPSSPIRIG